LDGVTYSLVDEKIVLTFASPVMSPQNLIESATQLKDPSTGTYYDNYKTTQSYNAGGFITSSEEYDWDSTSKSLALNYVELYYPDSHGNDTLEVDYDLYSAGSLDTNKTSYARTYDADGNNAVTIESAFSAYSTGWSIIDKDVNTFAQVNSAVLRPVQSAVRQGISVVTTASRVVVTAPDITGLKLYNAQGKMVASVKQQAAKAITLDLSKNRVSPGVYVAKLLRGEEQTSLRLSLQR
jgi:hypothetical protein